MAEVQIRAMLEPDLMGYKALRDAMLAGHPDAFTSDAETESLRDLASYRSRLAGGSSGGTLFTLLALDGGRVVGALTCEREPRRKVQHIAHLVGMMVSDTHRGRGIGRALLSSAITRLRDIDGLDQVTLSVTTSNRAAVGLYGVLAYDVTQRTREIGIRAAIGATRGQIVGLILRQGLAKAGLGLAMGLAGAFYLARFLRSLLFDVQATDPLAFGLVAGLLLLVALLASWLPARRAAKVDPVVALRVE